MPGISRAGITISAGLFAGLTREAAARFSFLMATPIIAGAGTFEGLKLLRGEAGVAVEAAPLVVGMLAALVAGLVAITCMLRYLRTRSYAVFVAERIVAGGRRPRRLPGALIGARPMEVMKQLRQRSIRDLVDAAPDPDPAGARGRPARARLPDDPGHDQPRRRPSSA